MNRFIEDFKKSPSFLIGIVMLIICIGFAFVRSNQLTELAAIEADLVQELDTISLNVKNSKDIEQDIQKLENMVNTIDERLFAVEERSANIDFFYSLEERLDVRISEVRQLNAANPRFSQKGPDRLKLYSVIDYSITVNGTFSEVLRVLYEIYQIEAIARVTEFEVDASNVEGSDDLSATIKVAVLAQK